MNVRKKTSNYPGSEAVPDSPDLLDALLALQPVDAQDDNLVNDFRGVRIVTRCALCHPFLEVKSRRTVERQGIAIIDVYKQAQVPLSCEVVRYQLAVLVDPDDVREVKNRGVLVGLGRFRCGYVSCEPSELEVLTGGLASGVVIC